MDPIYSKIPPSLKEEATKETSASSQYPDLPDEILEIIFKNNPRDTLNFLQLSRKWKVIFEKHLSNPEFLVHLLPFCTKPQILGEEWDKNLWNQYLDYSQSFDTSGQQVLYTLNNQYVIEDVFTHEKRLVPSRGFDFECVKLSNGCLFGIGTHGLEKYDLTIGAWEKIGKIVSRNSPLYNYKFPYDFNKKENLFAFSGKDLAGNLIVEVYNITTNKLTFINAYQQISEIIVSGKGFVVSYLYPCKFEVYDINGNLKQTIQKDNVSFLKILRNNNQFVVISHKNIGSVLYPNYIVSIFRYDSLSLEEINCPTGMQVELKGTLEIHDGIFYLFDDGKLVVDPFDKSYRSEWYISDIGDMKCFSFSGELLAIGKNSGKVALWKIGKKMGKLCEFSLKGVNNSFLNIGKHLPLVNFPEQVILDTENTVQLTVLLSDGTVQVWNPLIEYLERKNNVQPLTEKVTDYLKSFFWKK